LQGVKFVGAKAWNRLRPPRIELPKEQPPPDLTPDEKTIFAGLIGQLGNRDNFNEYNYEVLDLGAAFDLPGYGYVKWRKRPQQIRNKFNERMLWFINGQITRLEDEKQLNDSKSKDKKYDEEIQLYKKAMDIIEYRRKALEGNEPSKLPMEESDDKRDRRNFDLHWSKYKVPDDYFNAKNLKFIYNIPHGDFEPFHTSALVSLDIKKTNGGRSRRSKRSKRSNRKGPRRGTRKHF
jgi:hypothetical protein